MPFETIIFGMLLFVVLVVLLTGVALVGLLIRKRQGKDYIGFVMECVLHLQPPSWDRPVGMASMHGKVYITCESGKVYRLVEDYVSGQVGVIEQGSLHRRHEK